MAKRKSKNQQTKSSKNKTKRGDISRRRQRIRKLRQDWNHGEQYNEVERP